MPEPADRSEVGSSTNRHPKPVAMVSRTFAVVEPSALHWIFVGWSMTIQSVLPGEIRGN